jgi:hypothetical protein
MMVYNTQNHWFLDSVHHLEFPITRKHNVSETGSILVFWSGEGDTYTYYIGFLRNI